MAFISSEAAFEKFRIQGRNSSHFVWFLTKLEFFETRNGWVFGFLRMGNVVLFALEPLMPKETVSKEEFASAWSEVEAEIQPGISLFISVYKEFLSLLQGENFSSFQMGREPYVLLSDCIPTGKSGKGVRAARNQALRSGLKVEECSFSKIQSNPEIRSRMNFILKEWQGRSTVNLGGFLNSVNPFERMEFRRYFLATDAKGELQGFLVATPIPAKNSFFLEDLVLSLQAARGTGELLTLETMATLSESSGKYASLGVVATRGQGAEPPVGLPWSVKVFLHSVPKLVSQFYNLDGLETFRKRFKPQHWEKTFLALKNHARSGVGDSHAWVVAMKALFKAFTPKLNLSYKNPARALKKQFSKHPFSSVLSILTLSSFVFINRGGELPKWALHSFGFSGDSPIQEWIYRSITSDFLFFDANHFFSSFVFIFFMFRWMEKSYPPRFLFWVFLCGICLDDLVDQLVLIAPYSYFHPRLFQNLVAIKDVGPSLWIAMSLGVQLCSLRKYREILFAVLSVAIVLIFAFSAGHLSTLVLNLNHSLFFAIGFIVGKLRFEYERMQSKKVARQKPPVAKSVHYTPKRRASDFKGSS